MKDWLLSRLYKWFVWPFVMRSMARDATKSVISDGEVVLEWWVDGKRTASAGSGGLKQAWNSGISKEYGKHDRDFDETLNPITQAFPKEFSTTGIDRITRKYRSTDGDGGCEEITT